MSKRLFKKTILLPTVLSFFVLAIFHFSMAAAPHPTAQGNHEHHDCQTCDAHGTDTGTCDQDHHHQDCATCASHESEAVTCGHDHHHHHDHDHEDCATCNTSGEKVHEHSEPKQASQNTCPHCGGGHDASHHAKELERNKYETIGVKYSLLKKRTVGTGILAGLLILVSIIRFKKTKG